MPTMLRMFSISHKAFVCSLFLLVFCATAQAVPEKKTVKVGFFPMYGFHQYDKAGQPRGYDVDYLKRISAYTGWQYRFVRAESWGDALNMLADGRVDLVGSAQMSPERLQRFAFSAHSAGTTHTAILTLSGNDRMRYDDLDSFDNARFGCVRSFVRKNDFLRYAMRKGFSPKLVWFDTTEQMRKALHAREVDAMVCSIMEIEAHEKAVAEFSPAPFFYITRHENQILLEELNTALGRIKIDAPRFETELMDLWYPVSRVPSLSLAEREFVKNNPQLRVGHFVRLYPLASTPSGTENGELGGILPELVNLMGRESGLEIVPVPIPATTPPLDLLKEGRVDAIAGMVAFPDQARDPSLLLTETVLSSRMLLIVRRGEPLVTTMPLTVAVPVAFKAAIAYVENTYPNFSIVQLEDTESCLKAVQQRKADVAIQNSHVLERFLNGPTFSDLMVLPTITVPQELILGLRGDADPMLISVLNKSARRVPQHVVDQIVVNHTVANPYAITLKDFWLQYKRELLGGGSLLTLCLLFLSGYLYQRRKNMELIRENEEALRNITNNINGGVITLIADQGFTITYANNGFLDLVGYSREQYEDEQHQECVTYVHKDDVPMLNNAMQGKQRSGDTISLELRILHKNGDYVPVMFRGTLSKNKLGQVILFCVVMDISEQRAMLEKLKIEKERYEIVVEQSNDIIFEVDLRQQTLVCSPKFKQKFGWQMDCRDISAEKPYPLQVHPDDATTLQEIVQHILVGEHSQFRQLRIRKIDGEYLWCRLLVSSIWHQGVLIKLIGKIEDVDETVREHQRLEEMARTDSLCGLYNKRALRMSIERSLKKSEASKAEGALFFIDIDNFKNVNDKLGHSKGDEVLRDISSTLRSLFRSNDILGRFGGDEFCVFASHMPAEMVTSKAREINEHLRRSCAIVDGGPVVEISASIGIARSPKDSNNYEELVGKADQALYTAKSRGKNCFVVFDSSMSNAPRLGYKADSI